MKLLETLVLSQKPNYFQELFFPLPLETENVMGLEVHRLEIAEDLAVMLYEVSMEEAVSPEILGHLTPHLSALLLLSDGNFERMDAENQELVDSLVRRMDKIPLVVGVRCKDNNLPRVREDIFRRGMYLSEKGRLFFWNPEVRKSQTHLLTHLWSILQHSTILPSEMEEA